jgi:hypothetical protein
LAEGIAGASGGRSDFGGSRNDLDQVGVSQLELKLQPTLRG